MARLPFRKHLYDRAKAVQDRLRSVAEADAAYAELSAGATVILPVFAAIALSQAGSPSKLYSAAADLRRKASAFRARRVELDAALERRDLRVVRGVRHALALEGESLGRALGGAVGGATLAVVEEAAKGNVDQVALSVTALFAGVRRLVSSELSRRLLWRLRRPDLLFLNDVHQMSQRMTEAAPQIRRLWQLPDRHLERLGDRLHDIGELRLA